MHKVVALGEMKPDLPPADHLVLAQNAYPSQTGYLPVHAFGAITPALAGITGGAAFISSGSVSSFIAGDHNSLNRFSGGAWSSLIVALTADRWRFAQFGDNVISVSGAAPVSYSLTAGTAALLAGNPPAADLVATVRDFVVLAGNPSAILTVTWSGFNNSTQWTALANQSGSQRMLNGGEVMGLAGGEYGIILQRNAIKRMTYQGGDLVFSFDEISANVGCMAKGSVAQAGRLVFFLSERGFMLCDGNEARPIGAQRIDATFFATYSRQDIVAGIYAAVDPARNIVHWSMPGTPGMLWGYHWLLERWTVIKTDVRLVFSGFTANTSLDAIDTAYPGGIDTVPVSLDDPLFSGGNPLLLIATPAGLVGTLSGAVLPATFTLPRMELAQGRARIRTVKPLTDAGAVTIQVQGRARASDAALIEQCGDMRRNGMVPLRVNAQQIVTTMTLNGPWTYAHGLDFEFDAGGVR